MDNVSLEKSILANLSTANYYPLKRAFGCPYDEKRNIDALIAFFKVSDARDTDSKRRNAEFLTIGLCYNAMRPGQKFGTKKIRFENLLSRLTIDEPDSKPRTREIESFLKLEFGDDGQFQKRFAKLAKKAIPLLHPNEMIDYEHLLYDLKKWNDDINIKIRWAMSVVYQKNNNKNESEED